MGVGVDSVILVVPARWAHRRRYKGRDFQVAFGEVAERLKAAVLKTVEEQSSGGSNPSLSANQKAYDIYEIFSPAFGIKTGRLKPRLPVPASRLRSPRERECRPVPPWSGPARARAASIRGCSWPAWMMVRPDYQDVIEDLLQARSRGRERPCLAATPEDTRDRPGFPEPDGVCPINRGGTRHLGGADGLAAVLVVGHSTSRSGPDRDGRFRDRRGNSVSSRSWPAVG